MVMLKKGQSYPNKNSALDPYRSIRGLANGFEKTEREFVYLHNLFAQLDSWPTGGLANRFTFVVHPDKVYWYNEQSFPMGFLDPRRFERFQVGLHLQLIEFA